MTPTTRALLLDAAAAKIEARLLALDRLVAPGEGPAWSEYVALAHALAALVSVTRPEAGGRLLTTQEMAQKLGIAPKTLLRRRKRGQVQAPVMLGERGRAALRWRGNEAGR
jgi:hypothetical protein